MRKRGRTQEMLVLQVVCLCVPLLFGQSKRIFVSQIFTKNSKGLPVASAANCNSTGSYSNSNSNNYYY